VNGLGGGGSDDLTPPFYFRARGFMGPAELPGFPIMARTIGHDQAML
jgi:hypothetical protein